MMIVGVPCRQYTSHSFRIESRISDASINMLGRWESSVYLIYVKTPRETLASLSTQLVRKNETKLNKGICRTCVHFIVTIRRVRRFFGGRFLEESTESWQAGSKVKMASNAMQGWLGSSKTT